MANRVPGERPMTEADLRKRITAACEGARKAKLQVWGVEVGEAGAIRLVTAPEGVDRPFETTSPSKPDALDRWSANVDALETRQ